MEKTNPTKLIIESDSSDSSSKTKSTLSSNK